MDLLLGTAETATQNAESVLSFGSLLDVQNIVRSPDASGPISFEALVGFFERIDMQEAVDQRVHRWIQDKLSAYPEDCLLQMPKANGVTRAMFYLFAYRPWETRASDLAVETACGFIVGADPFKVRRCLTSIFGVEWTKKLNSVSAHDDLQHLVWYFGTGFYRKTSKWHIPRVAVGGFGKYLFALATSDPESIAELPDGPATLDRFTNEYFVFFVIPMLITNSLRSESAAYFLDTATWQSRSPKEFLVPMLLSCRLFLDSVTFERILGALKREYPRTASLWPFDGLPIQPSDGVSLLGYLQYIL